MSIVDVVNIDLDICNIHANIDLDICNTHVDIDLNSVLENRHLHLARRRQMGACGRAALPRPHVRGTRAALRAFVWVCGRAGGRAADGGTGGASGAWWVVTRRPACFHAPRAANIK